MGWVCMFAQKAAGSEAVARDGSKASIRPPHGFVRDDGLHPAALQIGQLRPRPFTR